MSGKKTDRDTIKNIVYIVIAIIEIDKEVLTMYRRQRQVKLTFCESIWTFLTPVASISRASGGTR